MEEAKKYFTRRITTRAVFDIETGELRERESYEYDGPVDELAFSTVRRAATISPGFGSPLKNDLLFTNSVALSGTTNATPVPATGAFAPTICRGWIIVRAYGGGGTAPTFALNSITGTDGTSTVTLYTGSIAGALSASVPGTAVELLIPFTTDLNLTSITVNSTLAGTSPTATMDVDVAGTTN